MELEPVFIIEEPVCAIELGAGRTTTLCARCGRGRTVQSGELSIELSCEPRAIWLSSRSAILLEEKIVDELARNGAWRVRSLGLQRRWRDGVPWANAKLPDLRQLVAEEPIAAAPASVEFEGCECGAVRSISFSPLIVRPPEVISAGVWFLKENPSVLVIGERLRAVLTRHDESAQFVRVYYEGEYSPPSSTVEGTRWDDLG
jgi:hypothetical protein